MSFQIKPHSPFKISSAFGSPMSERNFTSGGGYRYGFNGQEKDDEVAGNGNTNTAEYWEYDARLARRWNIDPKGIIGISDYSVNGNNPIYYTDPLGDFRTKFGANVYKFFHGGEVGKATAGENKGEYFVGKNITKEGDDGIVYQRTFKSAVSSVAEYGRGAVGAIGNFLKFALGGGGNQTYKEGSFEADEMASSPGINKGLKLLKDELSAGTYNPQTGTDFGYGFSPDPNKVIDKLKNLQNPLDAFSPENKQAHKDVFNDQSWTKLFIGGYNGKMFLMNANTVKVIITNNTTSNSFLLHGGEKIFGKENGAQRFNDLWNKTPFLNTQSQTFEFTVPLNK